MKKFFLIFPVLAVHCTFSSCSNHSSDSETFKKSEQTISIQKIENNLISQADLSVVRKGCKYKW